ncbi:MAG TPA: HNH endonuclease [Desulfobacterales bacterium]|nr:HNH endonuclease [Desulfobacterales bacterium]
MQYIASGELSIDEQGRIWRLKRRFGKKVGGNYIRHIKKKRAENTIGSGRYLQVKIMHKGQRIHCTAGRLVWQYFHGDIPDGLCINHKNGIKYDNRPDNLEIVTYSENLKHAHQLGLLDQNGETNPASTISDKTVEEIRNLYATGQYYQKDLAGKFNICFQTVSRIVRGDTRCKQNGPISKDNRKHAQHRDIITGQFIP